MDDRYRGVGSFMTTPFSLPRTTCLSEEDALKRLAALDLDGAGRSFESVAEEVLGASGGQAEASHLLYDILSRVQRVVADYQGLPQPGVPERLPAIRRLLSAASQDELRGAFWSTYQLATAPLRSLTPPGHPAVEQVRLFVQNNYTRKIALADIARAVGVSRNYLSHLFKRHCGLTVTEFIHRTRMKEAEKLLLKGGRTVSEIAYMIGYQNYRDFHRNFVKYQKTSPKKFRQTHAFSRRASANPSL